MLCVRCALRQPLHKTNPPGHQTHARPTAATGLVTLCNAMDSCSDELGSIVKEGDVVVLEGNTFGGPHWHLVRTITRRSIVFDVLDVLRPEQTNLNQLAPALSCVEHSNAMGIKEVAWTDRTD